MTVDDRGRPQAVDDARTALEQGGFFRERSTDAYSLTVLTNTGCNLGCGYCFQNVGTVDETDYRPDRIPSSGSTPGSSRPRSSSPRK
ncbi:hypothetical protein ACFQYP_14670 [Nonomuraea antimicrobica]